MYGSRESQCAAARSTIRKYSFRSEEKIRGPPLKRRGTNDVDDTNPKQKVVCISNDKVSQTVNDNGCQDEEMPMQE